MSSDIIYLIEVAKPNTIGRTMLNKVYENYDKAYDFCMKQLKKSANETNTYYILKYKRFY